MTTNLNVSIKTDMNIIRGSLTGGSGINPSYVNHKNAVIFDDVMYDTYAHYLILKEINKEISDSFHNGDVSLKHSTVSYIERQSNGCFPCKQKRGLIVFGNYVHGCMSAGKVHKTVTKKRLQPYITYDKQSERYLRTEYVADKERSHGSVYVNAQNHIVTRNPWVSVDISRTTYDRMSDEHLEKLIKLVSHQRPVINSLVLECLNDFQSKEADLLTNLAELPKTLGFLASTVYQALNILHEIRRRRDFATSLKTWSAIWMQYRYGLMPLIYTVQDALAVISKVAYNSKVVDERKKRVIENPSPVHPSLIHTEIHRVVIRGVLDIDTIVPKDLLDINVPQTAWELTPFSWLVDFFCNAGTLISLFGQNNMPLKEFAATYSIKYVCNDESDLAFANYEIYTRWNINPNLMTNFSIDFSTHLNPKRITDIVALILNLTIKDKKKSLTKKPIKN